MSSHNNTTKSNTPTSQLSDTVALETIASEPKFQGKENQIEEKESQDTIDCQDSKHNNEKNDYKSRFCFKCGKPLCKSRHHINVAGKSHHWHAECFNCDICDQSLQRQNSCHIYKDKILCRNDYLKLRQVECSRCNWPIGLSDWVRRAGEYVYHLVCFSCDICSRQLNTGEQFTLNGKRLLCRLHFAIESSNESNSQPVIGGEFTSSNNRVVDMSASCNHQIQPSASATCSTPPIEEHITCSDEQSIGQIPQQPVSPTKQQMVDMSLQLGWRQSPEVGAEHFGSRHKEFNVDDLIGLGTQANGANYSSSSHSNTMNHQTGGQLNSTTNSSKSKRVRTTFTEDQLSILQTHFQVDSNPDGQDLERIATITGLSKRVTQVWFQNSRARQKKYLIKRKPITCSSGQVTMGSVNSNNRTLNNQEFDSNCASGLGNLNTSQSVNQIDYGMDREQYDSDAENDEDDDEEDDEDNDDPPTCPDGKRFKFSSENGNKSNHSSSSSDNSSVGLSEHLMVGSEDTQDC